MKILELQQWVDEDWKKRSSVQPTVEQQILYVIEELGEVAEAIRKNSGNKERKQSEVDLGSEIADLLISIVTIANTFDVDIEQEIERFKIRLESRR